jgi:serine O-acetyltransferase
VGETRLVIDPKIIHGMSRWCWLHKLEFLADGLQRFNYFLTSCDLPYTAKLGKRVQFQHHGCGVIVHVWTVIGDDVMIHPHVVIGGNVRNGVPAPVKLIVIGDGVQLGAGAKIIASDYLEIGAGAHIGANAVVMESVPAGATAVGVPARIISAKG